MKSIRLNSFYQVVDGDSWTQAQANADNLGGHLVTINDESEYIWLSENIWGNGGDPLRAYFVGLNDVANEGNYVWSSGEITGWPNITDLINRQN